MNILKILTHIINKSIICGIFPNAFKHSIVLPLFKKDDRDNVYNYRPISILSPFLKFFEEIVKEIILKFLNKNNVFSEMQYDFEKDKSTKAALLNFSNRVLQSINKGCSTAALFFEIIKAFDLGNHNLLKKIIYLGFKEKLIGLKPV